MFTGIVEEIGTVASLRRGSVSAVLTVHARKVLEDVQLGDSIAVNGVCLTVKDYTRNGFSADVMHETLDRSNLGALVQGGKVNLERALQLNGRFGGHIVSGHIDGTGTVVRIQNDGNAIWYTISADQALLRYIVEKGSIAVDGISLTVARVSDSDFAVSTIPHTNEVTVLSRLKQGDRVNLECDIIAKYVEKLVGAQGGLSPHAARTENNPAPHREGHSGLTMAFLAANGF